MDTKTNTRLIGVKHFGAENARKVIIYLDKIGLREGDIVAEEYSENTTASEIANAKNGNSERIIQQLKEEAERFHSAWKRMKRKMRFS